jgi:aspartate/tyrosine/aromatic aminotransferase
MGKTAGFAVKTYRYYNAADKSVDFDGLVQDLDVKFNIDKSQNISTKFEINNDL